ncbi:short-chain dehydrogenase [Stagonosporopsis vannaccii]|nr:short-chain dehydrogenase [Stagonosporopsis vannaccii]
MSKFALLSAAAAGFVQAYTNTDVSQFMMKNIDPIVVPGEYTSHMHSFFGSDVVTKDLPTSEELRAGCATANNPNDFSVYWVPTLYYTGDGKHTAVKPKRFTAYYQFEKDSAEIPIPEDLAILAGMTNATTAADVNYGTKLAWLCGGKPFNENGKEFSDFPTKGCKILQTAFFFQDCYNEATKEVAWSRENDGECPSGMKMMPQVRFSIRYDVSSVAPSGWDGKAPFELACGPSHCMHGDFINGWDKEANQNMVDTLTKPRSFQSISGAFGKSKDGTVCKGKAADKDPENGTDDYETSLKMLEGSAVSKPAVSATPTAASTPIATATSTSDAVGESCAASKRSIGSKSKKAALRRKLAEALATLDELEQ